MIEQPDELSFLVSDAERVGLTGPIPPVTRFTLGVSDGKHISGLRFGTETPRVAFLHGAGLNAHTFDPTILALGLPAVSLDLPGHGQSSWRSDADYRPERMAADVAAALEMLSDEPLVLVGQSLGGLTALALAAEHPQRFQHVVIVDITPSVQQDDGGSTIREFIAGRREYSAVDEIVDRAIDYRIGFDREALRRGITLNTRRREDGQLEWIHHFAHLMTVDPVTSVLEPSRGFENLWQSVSTLRDHGVPLTLIRGSEGMVNEAQLEQWRRRVGKDHDVTVNAGHNVQEHAPKALAELVTQLVTL